MIILCIFLYIFFIFLSLYNFKGKKKKKVFVKKIKTRVISLILSKNKFFCSLNSFCFKTNNQLNRGFYIFDKISSCQNCLKILKDAGIDEKLPIYKYELYDKKINYELFYKFLVNVKRLDNQKISFNLFIFFDNYCNFKAIKKLVNYFKFKNVITRIYYSGEIDYKLLSVINFLNLNLQVDCKKQYKKGISNCFNYQPFIKIDKIDGFYLEQNDKKILLNDYCYKDFYVYSSKENNHLYVNFFRTYNYEKDLNLCKVSIENSSSAMQSIKLCFGKSFLENNAKNAFYCLEKNKYRFNIYNGYTHKCFTFYSDDVKLEKFKNHIIFYKELKVKQNEKLDFFFAYSEFNKKQFIEKFDIKILFENNPLNYLTIRTPKVISSNKMLNLLINEFLVNKIIEKVIVSGNCFDKDFLSLLSLKFNNSLLDKSFVEKKLSSFFLIKQDFFKTYFNLLYFYFGVWQDDSGVNLNPDKSKLEDNSVINLNFKNRFLSFKLKNKNLKNEIQVNNIKYSNLKYLNLEDNDKFTENIDLLY